MWSHSCAATTGRQSQYQRDALALLDELGFQAHGALVRARLGNLALLQGDLASAHAHYQASLAISQQIGSQRSLLYALDGAAGLAARSRRAVHAAQILGAAEVYRRQVGLARSRDENAIYAQTVVLTRTALGAAQFEAEFGGGQQISLDDVITFALAAPHA